jgi:hypothetical protein
MPPHTHLSPPSHPPHTPRPSAFAQHHITTHPPQPHTRRHHTHYQTPTHPSRHPASHVLQCRQRRQVLHGARHRSSARCTEVIPPQPDAHHTTHQTHNKHTTHATPRSANTHTHIPTLPPHTHPHSHSHHSTSPRPPHTSAPHIHTYTHTQSSCLYTPTSALHLTHHTRRDPQPSHNITSPPTYPSLTHAGITRTTRPTHTHHAIQPHTYFNVVSDVKCCTAPAIAAPPSAPRSL